ncbi:MAG: hypothetical protein ABIN18_20220 [Pseudomonadota bacterium]
MNNTEVFENLERANAQIDIWIDEEEYEKVIQSCEIDPELKIDEEKKPTLQEMFKSAFSDESCTANKDHEWLSILNHSTHPISAICNIPQEGNRIEIVSRDYDTWSRFFWAKLIRARIQQKGTDCYYRRLDQVVAYLERHCPPILSVNQTENDENQSTIFSNLLGVIYLLEMAASGEGVDQRSFANRARRIIKNKIKDKAICAFYDLLARYNIGLGYFHERRYRNAVLEFNWIIRELKNIWDKNGNFNPCAGTLGNFVHKRLGRDLLYLPAVLYRAEIQLKLQLAYHAIATLHGLSDTPFVSDYKEIKRHLIRAEALQQMDRHKEAWKATKEACKLGLKVDIGDIGQVKVLRPVEINKLENVRVKVQGLLSASYLSDPKEKERETEDKMGKREFKGYLNKLESFFEEYRKSAKYKRLEREGYLQQVAEYLAWLARKIKPAIENEDSNEMERKEIFKQAAESLFALNEEHLLEDEYQNSDCFCPCEEKGIDLRRLNQELYDAFSNNMRVFFREINEADVLQRKEKFLDRLKKLEKKARDNLAWRIRELDLEIGGNAHQELWCSKCLPERGSLSGKLAFGGLLKCADTSVKEKDNLSDRDYEQIMNHWDEHFLEHMKDSSFHKPRCRALHFLGLQRWNSSSPAQGRSLGGGYLIYHTNDNGCIDLGVAIDPGFDFVRNLFHVGFSLADIDVLLLSHAHVDHVRDFESMIGLLLELHKRTNKRIKRKLHTIMTLGVYRRLEYLIESPGLREFVEPYILDIEKEIDPEILDKCKFEFVQEEDQSDKSDKAEPSKKPKLVRFAPVLPGENGEESSRDSRIYLTIAPTKAYHNDFSEYSDSFGFIITIKDSKAEPQPHYTFGYTGDTSWNDDIIRQYEDKSCDALLVHLGSLIDREKEDRKQFGHYKSAEKCLELVCDKNHPYLMGMLHFLTEISEWKREGKKKPLVLMGEFGEEMRGKIRLDFVGRLKEAYGLTLDVLPVDVGLDVLLALDLPKKCEDPSITNRENNKPLTWCVQCKHFVPLDHADFIHYGHDEALFCVCKTCKKATPDNVLQERLRALYEVGRRLQIH